MARWNKWATSHLAALPNELIKRLHFGWLLIARELAERLLNSPQVSRGGTQTETNQIIIAPAGEGGGYKVEAETSRLMTC